VGNYSFPAHSFFPPGLEGESSHVMTTTSRCAKNKQFHDRQLTTLKNGAVIVNPYSLGSEN